MNLYFYFLVIIECTKNLYGNRSYVVSVWAGKETIRTRVMEQSKTWYRSWEKIIVYSDKFYSGTCEKIQKNAYPCQIQCISLGDYSNHLKGTEWKTQWYSAQPRFLPAMAKSYEINPKSDFYIFVDDDTFLIKQPILKKFNNRNSKLLRVTGVQYCAWSKITKGLIKPERNCHPFLQGGAGVIISNGLLSKVASELINCSNRFNDPDFAGSMRFAICMEKIFGIEKWSVCCLNKPKFEFKDNNNDYSEFFDHYNDENEPFIESWRGGLNSKPPKYELHEGTAKEPPASFHKMNQSDFTWLSKKIYINWKVKNKKFRADLGLFSFVVYDLPFIKRCYTIKWCVGIWIEIHSTRFGSKSEWKVILNNEKIPIGYEQTYKNGLTMRLVCNKLIKNDGKIVPLDISGQNNTLVYSIHPLDYYGLSN